MNQIIQSYLDAHIKEYEIESYRFGKLPCNI